jgi:hypothetical protein
MRVVLKWLYKFTSIVQDLSEKLNWALSQIGRSVSSRKPGFSYLQALDGPTKLPPMESRIPG